MTKRFEAMFADSIASARRMARDRQITQEQVVKDCAGFLICKTVIKEPRQ